MMNACTRMLVNLRITPIQMVAHHSVTFVPIQESFKAVNVVCSVHHYNLWYITPNKSFILLCQLIYQLPCTMGKIPMLYSVMP